MYLFIQNHMQFAVFFYFLFFLMVFFISFSQESRQPTIFYTVNITNSLWVNHLIYSFHHFDTSKFKVGFPLSRSGI